MRAVVIAAPLLLLVGCGKDVAPTPTSTTTTTPPSTSPPGGGSRSRVETKKFASAALGVDKDYVIYLPAGYDDDPARRWPVFYYLHGLTGNETNWTEHGDLAVAADRLQLAAIVVMPDGDDGFYTNAVATYDYDACMRDGTGLFVPGQPKAKTCVKRRAYEDYI